MLLKVLNLVHNKTSIKVGFGLQNWRPIKVIIKQHQFAQEEYKALITLQTFPYFPNLLESYCNTDRIVYKFIEGKPLYQYYSSLHKQSIPSRLKLFQQVLRLVQIIHLQSLIHNDISPGNILINQHQQVFIIDFGSTLPADDSRYTSRGKPHYTSPEQSLKQATSYSSDIYQLGCLLFEFITEHQYQDQFDQPQYTLNELNTAQPYKHTLEKFLHPEPKQRYQTITECLNAIDSLLSTGLT